MIQKITKLLSKRWQKASMIAIGSLVINSFSYGQVLITENFGTNPPSGWVANNISATAVNWTFNNPGARTITGGTPGFDANFAILDSDNQSATGEDAALESPSFNASLAGSYFVEYDNQYRNVGSGDGVPSVEVWNGTSWVTVLTYPTSAADGYPNPASHKSINITAATGGSAVAKVRFHWSNGSDDWWWAIDNVTITRATCVAPTATFTIVPNCPSNQFSVNVNITNMGNATSIGISDGTNTYGPATTTGTYVAGPYAASSTAQLITLTHNVSTLCNVVSQSLTYSCNDECVNAIPFPTLPTNGDCATVVANTTGATQSLVACAGTADDDIWYSFVCPAGITKLNFANTTVTGNTDRVTEFFSGTCGSLTSILCSDAETNSLSGLTPGATYYMRIYTYGSAVTTQVSVCLKTDPPAVYTSSTTAQPSTASISAGATNQNIIRMNIISSGVLNPLNVTQFDFNTTGTTNPADILNAKVYFTGTSTTFGTDSLFGTVVANPNGTFSVIGSRTLAASTSGTNNYFFLTYDLACVVPVGNTFDAQCTGIIVADTLRTPTATNPTGSRTLVPTATFSGTSSTTVTLGQSNTDVGRINITGSPCATSVSEVKFNISTSPAADISQARCYYTTTASGVETTNQFGSSITVIPGSGDLVFTGSKTITANSSNYFWLAYDVACSAGTVVGVDSLVAIPVSITTNAGTINVATPATNVKKKVNAPAAPTYTATTATTTTVGVANVNIGRINITGTNCNATVTSVKFNTATSPVGDLSTAKCYYTTGTTFNTDSLFGSPVISPSGDIIFNGSKTLATGTGNYFWLTYDISCTAGTVVGVDSVVATPVSITTNSGVINVATPSTNAKKKVNAQAVPTYTATTSTSTAVATANLTLGRIAITGDNCNATVTSVKFNTGASVVGDISRARCYYTTSTTFSTDSVFGSPVVTPNGDITFNGSKVLATGTGNYFWLTYDISCSAGTVAGVDSVVGTPVSITTNSSVISVATPSTNAKKGIIVATALSTVADGEWSSPSVWACGTIPTSSSNVVINNVVTVTTSGNVVGNVTIAAGKSLTISSGNLTSGPVGGGNKVFTNNGNLTVSGGTLNVNGNVLIAQGSTFTQSGGDIIVDGNDGTLAGSATGDIFAIGTSGSNYSTTGTSLTGGRILIVDPTAPSSTSIYAFVTYLSTSANNITASVNHTLQIGDGVSNTPAGSTNGFYVYFWPSTGAFKPGNYVVNTGNDPTRYIIQQYRAIIGGNLNIMSGEMRFNSSGPYNVAGNIIVGTGGILTSTVPVALSDGNYTGSTTLTPVASTSPQTISGSGTFRNSVTTPTANFNSLTINNTNAAGVTFADANSLLSGSNTGTVSGTLTMTTGNVNVGANALVLGTSTSATGTYTYTAGKIIGSFKRWLGTSTGDRSFDIGMGNVGRKVSINFTVAPTTGGSLTAKWNSANSGSNGLPLTEGANTYTHTSANGYWTVSAGDGLTGGTYTVAMTLTGGSDAPNYSTVAIGKRATSADPWALVGTAVAPTGTASNFTVSRTGVTGFSDFTLLLTSTPLSVKLSSFTGRNAGTINMLNWTTATEKDASHFDVMRSNDGNNFETLARVNAKNSLTGSTYEYADAKPFEGKNLYRLNMVDINGKSVYSDVVVLSVKSSAGLSLVASPNPVNQSLKVTVNGKIDGKAMIQIVDIAGKIVRKVEVSSSDTNIDMSSLNSGTYIIKYNDSSNSSVIKVIKN